MYYSHNTPSMVDLKRTALAAHDLLSRAGLSHVFIGGFVLNLMGSPRATDNVDVEVDKPFWGGKDKVSAAFDGERDFALTEQSEWTKEKMIVYHRGTGVFVNVWMRGMSNMAEKTVLVSLSAQHTLPCLSAPYLFIEKVKAASRRKRRADSEDIYWMEKRLKDTLQGARAAIVDAVWKKGITITAIANHPELRKPFENLQLTVMPIEHLVGL
jgi:hypothetical protein